MIAFVVPVHGRHAIADACLRRLRAVVDELEQEASCVMVGDEPRFAALADELAFEWIYAANEPLGRKWNDGYQYAALELAADYFVPLGSDDVVHPRILERLPAAGEVACTRSSSMVSPDGQRLVALQIGYAGGDGVRIFPRDVLEPLMFRPALEHKQRSVDGSIVDHCALAGVELRFDYRRTDPWQIVDFKTDSPDQRNSFASCLCFAVAERRDVWTVIGEHHGEELAAAAFEAHQ